MGNKVFAHTKSKIIANRKCKNMVTSRSAATELDRAIELNNVGQIK